MKPRIFISTPLEDELVERIVRAAENRATVDFQPDLLPPTRYVADHKGVDGFARQGEIWDRWCQGLAAADFLWDIPPLSMLPDSSLSLAANLRWVQTTSSGVQPLVRRLGLHDRGVTVTTAKGVHKEPLSEFVLMALLIYFRGLARLQSEQRAHRWQRYCSDSLEGKRIAIVGLGEVGTRVAELTMALGMKVCAMSRSLTQEMGESRGYEQVFGQDNLANMVAVADAIVLCVPESAATNHMIDEEVLSLIKPGSVLVNIARGSVIDEAALIETVRDGRIGLAVLDVAATEPLPKDSPLWDMPNVLISPHSASTVQQENGRITDVFIHNLGCILDGRTQDLMNMLDPAKD